MKTDALPAQISPRPYAADLVHERVIALLAQEKAGRLLDAPAGEGAFAARASRLGYEVRCGDIDPTQFRWDGGRCDRVDLNARWPYQTGTFDAVVSIEALEHLESPWFLAREAHRVLRSGGTLILTTPNVLTIKSRLKYLLYGHPSYFDYMLDGESDGAGGSVEHINPVGFPELRLVLARTGFELEQVACNRLLKREQPFYRLLSTLLQSRGRSRSRRSEAQAAVRRTLLSDTLLFGEILILKAHTVSQ
jgi:SAM-dependent methyltransferase